ncbi:MAG: 4Fe-4S ferredoxin [Oligosphaeraceae bacterium]|nr:4Fe-4S ferredoxin [Oligosphaeraceae bacterium]
MQQGPGTIAAHLQHLRTHGENKLHQIALDYLAEHGLSVPAAETVPRLACGCPGTLSRKLEVKAEAEYSRGGSALRQWPVQLQLLNPAAEYFDDADLLVSADCVAHAYGSFHGDFLAGKILVVFCPKLDQDTAGYVRKLAAIFQQHTIRSITILRMSVPCCGGTVSIVEQALALSGQKIETTVKTIGLDGKIE